MPRQSSSIDDDDCMEIEGPDCEVYVYVSTVFLQSELCMILSLVDLHFKVNSVSLHLHFCLSLQILAVVYSIDDDEDHDEAIR